MINARIGIILLVIAVVCFITGFIITILKKKINKKILCIPGIICRISGIIICFGSLSLNISLDNVGTSSEKNRDFDAWNCATDAVKNELYHYSNIKVSTYSNSEVSYTSDTDIYTIKGTVKYTNKYGANVNYKFAVNLQLTAQGYKNSSVLIY